MGEEFYKTKSKAVKKELRAIRAQMDEQKEAFQNKVDQIERERDELAEKIDQDFPRPQTQMAYDFFEQVTMWHWRRNFDTPSTTLPMTAAEVRACGKSYSQRITDVCQYERAKIKLSMGKNNEVTSNIVHEQPSNEIENPRITCLDQPSPTSI